jgi:leader peptidase (prepilin peptidase)/N-methyltransferase
VAAVSALPAVVLGVLGVVVGTLVDRLAARYPWPAPRSLGSLVGPGPRALPRGVLEVVGAVVFALVGLRSGWSAELPAWMWFAGLGLLLSVVDLREHLLPNRVLVPGTVVTAGLLALAAAVGDDWSALGRALAAAAAGFLVLLVMALIAPAGLGMGDVKLAALLGLVLGWIGWPALLLGLFLGFLLQAVAALALLGVGRAGRSTELPFGPALVAGALAAALLSGGSAAL